MQFFALFFRRPVKPVPVSFYLIRRRLIPFPVRNCTIAKAIGGGRRPPLQCKSKLETV
jgi:hypothetical protein